MATGDYRWDVWNVIDAAITLTQGGVTTDLSAEIDADQHVAALLSIDADYSNHALATAGLSIYIEHDVNGADYETQNGASLAVEMPFTQNGTQRKVFRLDVSQFEKFKIYAVWGNTTGGSSVTFASMIKYCVMNIA